MGLAQCYEFRSVRARTDGIFRTSMQTGTRIASAPLRIKFRPISASFRHSGHFQAILAKM